MTYLGAEGARALEIVEGARWPASGVVATIVFGFNTVANFVVVLAFVKKHLNNPRFFEMLGTCHLAICNIIGVDLVYSLTQLSVMLGTGANLNNSQVACEVHYLISSLNISSQLFLVLLAATRYAVVRDPLGLGMSKKRVYMWSVLIHLATLMFAIFTLMSKPRVFVSGLFCSIDTSGIFSRLVFLVVLFTASALIFWFYFKVWTAVKADAANCDRTILRQLLKCILALNVAFTISQACAGSLSLYRVIKPDAAVTDTLYLEEASYVTLGLSFAANPIAYCVYITSYRAALLDFIGIHSIRRRLGYPTLHKSKSSVSAASTQSGGEAKSRLSLDDFDDKPPSSGGSGSGSMSSDAISCVKVRSDSGGSSGSDAGSGSGSGSGGHLTNPPLSVAIAGGYLDEADSLLVSPSRGADGVASNAKTPKPLLLAAAYGQLDDVERLASCDDVDVNVTDTNKQTALHLAAANGHLNVVEYLVTLDGMNVTATDVNTQTALHFAAAYGHLAVVKYFVTHGLIDVNARSIVRQTPLHLAAAYGHIGVVELLLSLDGADANAANIIEQTPMHLAAANGHLGVVALLASSDGVDAQRRNEDGETARECAVRAGRTEDAECLRRAASASASASGDDHHAVGSLSSDRESNSRKEYSPHGDGFSASVSLELASV